MTMTVFTFKSLMIALLLVISLLPQNTVNADTLRFDVEIKWSVRSFPAMSICSAEDYIYVVGSPDGHGAKVEMRYWDDGSLIKTWSSIKFEDLADCVIIDKRLYAVGLGWNILVFDLKLNLLDYVYRDLTDWAYSVVSYGDYLYIAGSGDTFKKWRVEMWRIKDLTLVKEYSSDPTEYNEYAASINVNPVTKQLWVVGMQGGRTSSFRVEILDLYLNPLRIIERPDRSEALTITFDNDGYAYIGGEGFIAKYDKYGNEITMVEIPSSSVDILLYDIVPPGIYDFLFAFVTDKTGVFSKQVLYIFDKNLNQVYSLQLGGDIRTDAFFRPGKADYYGYLYVAGGERKEPGQITSWTIYAIHVWCEEMPSFTTPVPPTPPVLPTPNYQPIVLLGLIVFVITIGLLVVGIIIIIKLIRKG